MQSLGKPLRLRRRRGFTLVELLTVVGVLSFLMVGLGILFADTGSSTVGLKNARLNVGSVINNARSFASLRGVHTRVIIYDDSADATKQGKRLRLLGVVSQDETGDWRAVSNPVTLPDGVYFVPPSVNLTDANGATVVPSKIYNTSSGTFDRMTLRYPTASGSNRSPNEDYIYIEFTPEGRCLNANSTLMFVSASRGSATDSLETGSNARSFVESLRVANRLHATGVILLNTGNVSYIEDISGLVR